MQLKIGLREGKKALLALDKIDSVSALNVLQAPSPIEFATFLLECCLPLSDLRWKDADPNIAILKEAKTGLAKL